MARRGENIYKRKDGRWEGRYIKGRNSNGKAIYGYIYSDTYSKLKEKLIKVNCECKISPEKFNNIKFSEYAFEWLEVIKNNIKHSSYVKYRNIIEKHIVPDLGNYKIQMINTEIINELCINKINKQYLSPKTVKDILSVIKLIIKFKKNSGITCNTDFKFFSIKYDKLKVKCMTGIQFKKLKEFLIKNINYVNIGILISFYTGVRIGELCALKFEDISFDSNTLYINKTMQRVQNFKGEKVKTDILISSPKSECSVREIPLPLFIINFIKENNMYKKDAYLLTGEKTKFIEPRTLENKFKKIAALCNIDSVNFHMIRHTFASNCIEAGVDIKSLSEILGHSNVNITLNRYVHSSMQNKKMNMEKFYSYL